MAQYYYFAATLPTPQMGSPPPLSSEAYLQGCALHLRPLDYRLVAAAHLQSPPEGQPEATVPSPLLTRYYAWERTLRNELARLRGRRLERDAETWIRPTRADDTAGRAAAAVFAASSPLEAEILLERERWALLSSLAARHIFDLERLAAYRLEIQVLERLSRLREAEGVENYRRTYAAILGGTSPGGTAQGGPAATPETGVEQ